METVPPEILTQILEYVAAEQREHNDKRSAELAQYSSVSRAWKSTIERFTFKSLTITTDELDTFAALYSNDNILRRSILTSLKITIVLPPPHNPAGCCHVVRVPDRKADSVAFSASMSKLFTVMENLENRAIRAPPLHLQLYRTHRSSRDQQPKNSAGWPHSSDTCPEGHTPRQIKEADAVSGQFELVWEDTVPILRGVTAFEFNGYDDMNALKPTWLPTIAAQLPHLEKMFLEFQAPYNYGRRRRHAQREYIAASIRSLANVANDLRELRLSIYHGATNNENSPVQKFVNDSRHESCSRMLKYLASFQSLTKLQMLGGLVICPEFFRSIATHTGTPFPLLVEFELEFAPETADGRWYYQRDDEALKLSRRDPKWKWFWREKASSLQMERERHSLFEHEEDVRIFECGHYVDVMENGPFATAVVLRDRFRSMPNATTLLPFLKDASKFVSRCSNLQKFILKLGNGSYLPAGSVTLDYSRIVSRVFELWYLKSGAPRSPHWGPRNYTNTEPGIPGEAAHLHRNRLYWRVDRWKPWDEVQQAWNALAGPDAKVVFLDEANWKKSHWRWECYYDGEL